MKMQMTVIGAALATLFAASAFARDDAASTMTVDSNAPIRATLLPTVSIDATPATSATNPATMRIADTAAMEVTLLPTVHVRAPASPELAVTLLPTVRVTASSGASSRLSEPVTDVEDVAQDLRIEGDESPATIARPFGLRTRTMPR